MAVCRHGGWGCALALLVTIGPALAAAPLPTVAEHMERARLAEQKLDYDVAAELWSALVARRDLTPEQRFEANLNAGRVHRILGRDTEARMNFLYVLRQQPGYRLPPSMPPKVVDFFELVRQEVLATEVSGTGSRSGKAPVQPKSPTAAAPAADTTTATASPAGRATTTVATSTAPAAAPATGAPTTATLSWPLLIGGGAVAAAGIAALALGGVSAVQFATSEQRALATDEQVERDAIYDERDTWAWAADIGFASGALLAIGGATLLAVGLFWSGE